MVMPLFLYPSVGFILTQTGLGDAMVAKKAARENRVSRQHPEMYKITKEERGLPPPPAFLPLFVGHPISKGEPNHSTILNASGRTDPPSPRSDPGVLEMQ